MWGSVRWLVENMGRAVDELWIFMDLVSVVQEEVFEGFADEDPLDVDGVVEQERANEGPISGGVEEEFVADGLALIVKGDEPRGWEGFSVGVDAIDGQVGVAAGLVGVAPGDSAALIEADISDLEGGAAQLGVDVFCGGLDGLDELGGAEGGLPRAVGF